MHKDSILGRQARFALFVLTYLAQKKLVPDQFSAENLGRWGVLMRHTRELDLFELAVRDAARANPSLFRAFVAREKRNELRTLDQAAWQEARDRLRQEDLAGQSSVALYRRGAEILDVELPPLDTDALEGHDFGRSSLIAELPEGCGYPSLLLYEAYEPLDSAHNIRIFVESVEAEMLAAWAVLLTIGQLEPPNHTIRRVSREDHASLSSDTYDAAVAYRPVSWLDEVGDSIDYQHWIAL